MSVKAILKEPHNAGDNEMAETITDIRGLKFKELVEEMKLYNDPKELEEIRKIMRKNVPLTMRGYLLAYLFMTQNENSRHSSSRPRSNGQAHSKNDERKSASKTSLEDAVSFYINVGKTSKSSPKELAQFICEKANLKASDIVSIAYKPSYSFIYIKKDAANSVIESLNGQIYKNRKVKINYSKEKDAD